MLSCVNRKIIVTVHPFRIVPVFENDPPLAPPRRRMQEVPVPSWEGI